MKHLFFSLLFVANAAFATSSDDAVQAHVSQFNAEWVEPLPADSFYGIEQILPLFDLETPGLEAVKAAAERSDYPAAQQLLLEYFKSTRQPKPVKTLREKDALHASDALRHYFRGNRDAHPPVFRGADIDWTGRAFIDGEEIHDAEWYFQFQRLTWWPSLGRAYSASGDEKYFFEWRYEMVDWAQDNLPFTKKTAWPIRRGMETYDRCARLSEVFAHMLQSPNFDSKTLCYFLSSFHYQAQHIRTVYAAKGNHLLGELSAVFMNGIHFPEFKASEAWKQDALERLPEMMFSDVYEDGMNRELVFSYHTMYMSLFANAYQLFADNGYSDHIPEEYYRRLLEMAKIYALQSFPDQTVCQFGDGWKYRTPSTVFRKYFSSFREDIPFYDYMVSGGKEGVPPEQTNAAYPQSGFYFFRSEWSKDAVFMPVKNGVGNIWHSQIDNGTFELFAYGRNFMVDSGSYMYGSSSDEDKRWRNWFRSSKVHQTLTLDKQDIDLKPRFVSWDESDDLSVLVIENQSHADLLHRRTVMFIDKQYFLIFDEAEGSAAGAVRTHFQLVPCKYSIQGQTIQTRFEDGPNLFVKNFPQANQLTLVEQEEGWISYKPQVKERRPAFCFRTDKSAEESSVQFLTALVPCRDGEAPKMIEARVIEGGFELTVDSQSYTIQIDRDQQATALEVELH